MLEGLGHVVEQVEVPTVSEQMIPPFIVLTQAGLGDYEGIDWSRPSSRTSPTSASSSGELGAYDYVLAGAHARAASAAGRSRAGAATSTSC